MVTIQYLWTVLSLIFVTLLVSAQVFEFYYLIFNLLPSKQQTYCKAFERSALSSVYWCLNQSSRVRKNITDVLNNFVQFFHTLSGLATQ